MPMAATVALVALCSVAVGAQKPDKKIDQKTDQTATVAQSHAQQVLRRAADAAMAGQPVPSDFPIQFQNDFLKAQGTATWVPFTLTMDPAKVSGPALLYVRVTRRGMAPPPEKADKGGKGRQHKSDQKPIEEGPTYPYEQVEPVELKPAAPGQAIRIVRGIPLQPGSYDFYVVIRERPAAPPSGATGAEPALKMSVLKQPLDVPDYSNGELSTSTVILADRVEHLDTSVPPSEQTDRPYAFGQTEIVVSPDRRFRRSQELVVLLQIYNPMLTPDKKFSLEATYTFFQAGPGGEKRFNSTEPQELTADTINASDLSKTSIQAGQAIPLESFPEGSYRLEIKVTDKLSSKIVSQSVNFTVTP